MADMRYHPALLELPAGDRLVIELRNDDPYDTHDLVLASGVRSDRLRPGQSARVDAGVDPLYVGELVREAIENDWPYIFTDTEHDVTIVQVSEWFQKHVSEPDVGAAPVSLSPILSPAGKIGEA